MPFKDIGLKFSAYGVLNIDRLAASTSANREVIASFDEAGIEINANNIAPKLRKLTFDYAAKVDYEDWTSGNTYTTGVFYNSLMLSTDITDNLNLHAGAIIRNKTDADAAFVPAGFAFGVKLAKIPFLGKPMFWAHFCYGMNPYSENNYSLYRADNWMNKASHRTYLLNDLYEDYTTSHISFGLIWNLQ